MILRTILTALAVIYVSFGPIQAQTQISFGENSYDQTAPIEITSDQLSVADADSAARFMGNVEVTQGTLLLKADLISVIYGSEIDQASGIKELNATGNVRLVNGAQTVQAENATYNILAHSVKMSGTVILTQGRNTISANSLTLDLNTGNGRLDGQIRTVIQTGTQ